MRKSATEKLGPAPGRRYERENYPWERWEIGIIKKGILTRWQFWQQSEVAQFLRRKLPGVQQASHKVHGQMNAKQRGKSM